MKALVIAEHDNYQLNLATHSAIAAGCQLTKSVDVLVAGSGAVAVAEQLAELKGVNVVIHIDAEALRYPLAENLAEIISNIGRDYQYIIAAADTFGKNIIPRAAALLDVEQVSDVIEILGNDTYKRPIYAGNAIQTVQNIAAIQVLTVRCTAFKLHPETQPACEIQSVTIDVSQAKSQFIKLDKTESERPELTTAKVVVSGGRGLQNAENFKLVEALADKLGAAVGATRAAVDAGFIPNDYQVGQTGKIVAPELYIALGISGAIQHLAGMKDSKCIVAVNKDADAPIFQMADLGYVGDLFEFITEFEKELDKLNA